MIIDDLFEASQSCPHCGGPMFSEMLMMEKKDACYYKVKASAKVWPSAYASGRLVQCRKKGAGNYGNKSEGVMEMDKSQTPPGRDGSNDEGGKKEYTAKATTAKKVAKDAEKILNKELNKKQGVAEATGDQKFDSMMGQITGGATARQSVDSLNKSLTARTGSDPETALAKWGQEFINWLEKICRNFERQGVDRFNKLEKVGNLDDGGETMAHWLIEVAKQSNTSGITQADIQEFSSEFNTHGMWAWHQFPIAWGLKEWQDYKDQWTGPDGYIANLGQGMAEGSESDAYGNTGEKHECGSCDGTGIDTHDDECPECGGKGWVRNKEALKKKGMAEEYELAGVGVAYELGRRAYKQGMTIRDNPYSATREARKNDEWAKGLERGKHDANDARHLRSSVREQGVAEGDLDEGWKEKLGGAALAGAMALGAGGANARVTPDGQGGFTGGFKPSATMTSPADNKPAAEAPKGFSKEYLQSVIDGKHPRPMVSVEKAKELLKNMQEGDLNEKSTSQAQFRTMAAAAHNPEFAKKVGISQDVAQEFHGADRKQDYADLPKKADESKSTPKEKEADYGDDYQDMIARVKKLAGLGPLKTVYDPQKRVYRNMPTAVQPKK